MGQVISSYEQIARLPGYDTNPAGLSPLLVTQKSATSGGLWGVMDGGMIDFLGDVAFLYGGWAGAPTNPDWPSGTVTNLVYRSLNFGVTWAKIRDHDLTPDATHFGPVHYGAHCVHNVGGTNYIYLIGGDPSGTGEYVHSDTRRTTDGITWTKMNSGNAAWHGLNWGRAFSLGGNLYLIGGHVSPGGVPGLEPATAQNGVWRSTDNGVTWASLGNAPWAVRIGPERIPVWQGKAWLVGGGAYANNVNNRTFYNDVWTFDGTTWTEVLANGIAPWPARAFANVEVFDGWLYVSRGSGVNGNRSDTWRSRDGITWMEVDLGPYFIPSHADGMATHATGIIQASGNGRFANEVNTNSPTFFITAPTKPLADGVVDIVAGYVASNVSQYDGIITEGYTESTNPRALTPGDNAKLTEISGKHYHDTEEDVFIVGMYSYGAGNVCYIGGGMTPTKNALTQLQVILAANDATLATAAGAKTAVDLSSTKAQVQYNTITIGCNEAAVYGPRTANTAKFGELAGVTYADNGTTLGFTGLGVYSYGANNHAVIIGGGSASYGATLVQTYIAPNGTTVSGTLVNQTDINGTALGGKLSVGKNTTGTVFTIDAVGLYFLIGGNEASGTGHARTDSLNKLVLLAMPNYTGANIALMQGYSISGQNIIDWGGNNASYRAATLHRFVATATPTSGFGTEMMHIDVNSSATDTGILLRNDGTMKRVSVGAADSGGTGFRLLRVAN